jgi:hypothetical protein
VWVRVPRIDASSDTDHVFMDYGDETLADAQNKTGVWSSDMRAVWHLAEDPGPGTANSMRDSTSNANHGTPTGGMTAADHVAGPIGFAVRLDGNSNGITASTMTLPQYTWSMFIRGDTAPALASANKQPISNGDVNFNFAWDHSGSAFVGAAAMRDASMWRSAQSAFAAATWYHVASTYNGTNLCIYVNGVAQCTASGAPLAPNASGFLIGLAASGAATFAGHIDELRVSSTPYSAARIGAEVVNQRANPNDPFVVFGSPAVVP